MAGRKGRPAVTDSRLAKELARWEARLRADGLAPLDQTLRGRLVIRTEIISPLPMYIPDPLRLAVAIEAWLRGDGSHFKPTGLTLLRSRGRGGQGKSHKAWPRARARILLHACRALLDGLRIGEIYDNAEQLVAYKYMRPLYATLDDRHAHVDDDQPDDAGPHSD